MTAYAACEWWGIRFTFHICPHFPLAHKVERHPLRKGRGLRICIPAGRADHAGRWELSLQITTGQANSFHVHSHFILMSNGGYAQQETRNLMGLRVWRRTHHSTSRATRHAVRDASSPNSSGLVPECTQPVVAGFHVVQPAGGVSHELGSVIISSQAVLPITIDLGTLIKAVGPGEEALDNSKLTNCSGSHVTNSRSLGNRLGLGLLPRQPRRLSQFSRAHTGLRPVKAPTSWGQVHWHTGIRSEFAGSPRSTRPT